MVPKKDYYINISEQKGERNIMKKMTRLFALVMALVMVLGLTACGSDSPADTPADTEEQTYTMVLAHNEGDGTTRDLALEKFAELVNQYTNGRVTIDINAGGVLGDWRECIEGLPVGTCNIVCESVGSMQTYSDLANIDAIPYMYESPEHWYAVRHSELKDEILDMVSEDSGFKLVGASYRGARIVTSTKKFTTPDEVAGLKIRVPALAVYEDTWADLKAVGTPLSLNEVYTAIEQGTVEAQENPLSSSYGFGLYDCCPYLIMTNHVMSFDTLIFDQNYWDALPADIQEAILKASDEADEFRWDLVMAEEENYVQKFVDAGCEVVEPDIAAFSAFFADFTSKHYPELEELAARIRAMA